MPKHPAGRPGKNRSHDVTDLPPSLESLGIAKMQSARAQKLAALDEETVNTYLARQKEAQEEITRAGILRFAGSDGTICTKHNNDIIDWYTPAKYIEAARGVMGSIDLDPASSELANETAVSAQANRQQIL